MRDYASPSVCIQRIEHLLEQNGEVTPEQLHGFVAEFHGWKKMHRNCDPGNPTYPVWCPPGWSWSISDTVAQGTDCRARIWRDLPPERMGVNRLREFLEGKGRTLNEAIHDLMRRIHRCEPVKYTPEEAMKKRM